MRVSFTSLAFLMVVVLASPVFGQNNTLTYQGQLRQNETPFTGTADLSFQLFDSASSGSAVSSAVAVSGVSVTGGLFQVELNFPTSALNGNPRYLELSVGNQVLSPRQRVTATPYALIASSVAEGAVDSNAVDPAEIQLRVSGSCSTGESIQSISTSGSVSCVDVGWGLNGNAGTNPAINFLGTTDSVPFEIRTANVRGLRIEPSVETFAFVTPAPPITANIISGSYANEVTAGVRGATLIGGALRGIQTWAAADPIRSPTIMEQFSVASTIGREMAPDQ